jgi:hypothetical protein
MPEVTTNYVLNVSRDGCGETGVVTVNVSGVPATVLRDGFEP